MAILWFDGFDRANSATLSPIPFLGDPFDASSAQSHSGGLSWISTDDDAWIANFAVGRNADNDFAVNDLYVSFYLYCPTGQELQFKPTFMLFYGVGGTVKAFIAIENPSGGDPVLHCLDSGGITQGTTSTFSRDAWHRIDVRIGTGTSASWELKVDGSTEASGSADFRTDQHQSVFINNRVAEGDSYYVDDIVVRDDAFHNSAGEFRVATINANGAGNYTAWTGAYTDVDNEARETTKTYLSSSTNNDAETVTLENISLAAGESVAALMGVWLAYKFNVAPSVNCLLRTRISATDYDSAAIDLFRDSDLGTGEHESTWIQVRESNPAGGSWDETSINAVELGIVHAQAQAREARCEHISANVLINVPSTDALSASGIATAAPVVGTPTLGPLIWDNFDDAENTAITSHTPNFENLTGTAYTSLRTNTNDSEIQGNYLVKPAEASWLGGFHTWDGTGGVPTKFVLGMRMTPVYDDLSGGTTSTTNSSGVGWVFHGVDSNNHFMVRIRWNGTTNYCGIYRRRNGGITSETITDIGGANQEYVYELEVDTVTRDVELFRDGSSVLTHTLTITNYDEYENNDKHGPYLLTRPGGSVDPYQYEQFWLATAVGWRPPDSLHASGISSTPVVGTPTLTENATGDNLTADSIATGAPVVANSTIGQVHVLTATGLTTTPVVADSTIGQEHALTATGITTTPVVDTPTADEIHNLSPTGITTTPVVADSTIGQTHVLTATGIATGAPVVDTPTVGQEHSLTATGIATGALVVGTPTLGQSHVLTATGITTTPVVDTPTATHIHDLTATGITTTPVVGTPAIGQEHALSATGIATGAPVVGTPTASEIDVLSADGIATGAVSTGSPAIGQTHVLTATGITTTPVVDTPTATHIHDLTADGITTTPVVDTPTIGQGHALTATAIATGAPVTGTPTTGQSHMLDADSIATTPVVGTTTLGQTHVLTATGITTTPVVADATIGQEHALTATSIATGAPVEDQPSLTDIPATDDLIASDMASSAPVVGAPTLTDVDNLSSNSIATGAPVVQDSTIGQEHALTATGLTSTPVVDTPTLTTDTIDELSALQITVGAPVVGTPTASHIHDLTATAIATGAPVIGSGGIGQIHVLTATSIATGAPVLETPTAGEFSELDAISLLLGAPVVGSPGLGQVHVMSAAGVLTGAPIIDTPTLAQDTVDELTSVGITAGAPVVGTPTLVEVVALSADSIATGSPDVSSVVLAPVIGQDHQLTASGIESGAPVVGTPDVDEYHSLSADGIATTPAVGSPDIGQTHVLLASSILVAPRVGTPAIDGSFGGIDAVYRDLLWNAKSAYYRRKKGEKYVED